MSLSPCPGGAGGKRQQRWLLALACLASFGVVLDATIVSIALPQIRDDLGFTAAGLSWVVSAYTLVFAGCLLLGGRLTDMLGQRTTLLLGLVVFNLARVACGLASDPAWLLALRAAQGLGGALLMPASLALVTSTFTDDGAH